MNIYYISGLGADQRAFGKLDFVKQHKATYLPWIAPLQKKESMESYAQRLSINIKGEDPILVGLSFGGMMAMEIAKIMDVKRVVLISSCKTKNELPPQIKMAGQLGLDNLVPISLVKNSKSMMHTFLGTKSESEKAIADDFINQLDEGYLSWALRSISRWKNTEIPCPVSHIHGDKDLLLQNSFVEADYIVEGGNHFMIYNQAQDINPILEKILSEK
jgi:pimeloyl-ACP methyl ester carboxylesterase